LNAQAAFVETTHDHEVTDRRTLRLVSVAAFASMASMRCTDSILPALTHDFTTTTAVVAGVISAFALGYRLLQLASGVLGDRHGKFRVVAFGTLACTFTEGLLAFGTLAFVPSCLYHRFGLPMAGAGGIMALFGVGGLVYSRSAGLLLRGLGQTRLAAAGGALFALSLCSLALIDRWQWSMISCALAGFSFYALHGTLQTHATQMAPAARGAAMSLFSSCLFLGQSVGVLMSAWIVDRFAAGALFAAAALGVLALSAVFARQLSLRGLPGMPR